ncbi:hypothetical protein BC629DRAFT_1447148 [Irpex lacteus]|nr:hypothetical protein BC629DRAFT_1447148 [Irpex lacteus]
MFLGVFPMAVEQDVLIACGTRIAGGGKEVRYGVVKARNLAPKYGPQEFVPTLIFNLCLVSTVIDDPSASHDVQWHIDIDTSQLRWENYVKAGYYGVLERFFTNVCQTQLDILVTGSVPAGSGLSSSAALVVASDTFAFLAVNDKLSPSADGKRLTKGELVEMAVENERRVGVNSDGLAAAYHALDAPCGVCVCEFEVGCLRENAIQPPHSKNPRRSTHPRPPPLPPLPPLPIPLSPQIHPPPRPLRLPLCPPFSPPPIKSGLERLLRVWLKAKVLRREEFVCPEGGESGRRWDKDEIVGMVDEDSGVSLEEITAFSGLSERSLGRFISVRLMHVLTEALRVLQVRQLCLTTPPSSPTILQTLGTLLTRFHTSCSAVYACSHPRLALTSLALSLGAYGSRLTGAG